MYFAITSYYTLHPKLWSLLSLLLILMKKYHIMWKYLIAPHLNPLKTMKKLYFTTLKYNSDCPIKLMARKTWTLVSHNYIWNFKHPKIYFKSPRRIKISFFSLYFDIFPTTHLCNDLFFWKILHHKNLHNFFFIIIVTWHGVIEKEKIITLYVSNN